MPITDPFLLLCFLLVLVGIGIWAESLPKVGAFGVVGIIVFAAIFSMLGVIPSTANTYFVVASYCVPLAIPLLLFEADLKRIWRESGRVLLAFVLAAFATEVGAVIALQFVDLGVEEGVWAAIMTAGFVGGSANTAAVADAMGKLTDPYIAVVAASVYVVAVPFMAFLLALPSLPRLWGAFSPQATLKDVQASSAELVEPVSEESAPITTASIAGAIAVSGVICGIAHSLSVYFDSGVLKYLLLTLLAVAFASLFPRKAKKLNGHYQLGQLLIYLFFAVIGAQINFTLAVESGGQIVLFSLILLAVHMVILSVLGRLFKLNGPELAVASNACIMGPPTAAAMAVSRGWHGLVTPSMLCGVFGYAIATVIGLAMASWY